MLEADYFYEDHLRWNLGFASPNHAGAFLAIALPVLWWLGEVVLSWLGGQSACDTGQQVARLLPCAERVSGFRSLFSAQGSKRATIWTSPTILFLCVLNIVLLIEVGGWWVLAQTGSRGGLVAALGALIVFSVAMRRNGWQVTSLFVVRMLIAGLGWWASGFGGRTAAAYLVQDASIAHRLMLWQGGLRMIAASPWHGWGSGESGRTYEEYFQPLEHTEHYHSLVCSYLTVAAEYGLPMLGAALWIFLWPTLLAWRIAQMDQGGRMSRLSALCCAVLVVGLLVHVWSNLWIVHLLWIMPTAAVLMVLCLSFWNRWNTAKGKIASYPVWHTAVWAFLYVLMGMIGILAMGAVMPSTVHVIRNTNGLVTLEKTGIFTGLHLAVYPDEHVLGDRPGAECRRLLMLPTVREVAMAHITDKKTDVVLLCGARSLLALELIGQERMMFIHPTGMPNNRTPILGTSIVLPEFSFEPRDEDWIKWSAQHAAPLRYSPRCGKDIRSAWPIVIKDILDTIALIPVPAVGGL